MKLTQKQTREVTAGVDFPSHLAHNERAALVELVERLYVRYGDNLLRVALFGSKARGDFDEESDLDVLIVVRMSEEEYGPYRRQISDVSYEIELERKVVFSILLQDEVDYSEMRQRNLLINRTIEQDGVELWTLQPRAPLSV